MHTVSLSAMTPPELLQKLKAAHSELQSCLSEMEALTTGLAVSRPVYSSARFRISNASLKRRATFNAVRDKLSQVATAEEASVICRLREADLAFLSARRNMCESGRPSGSRLIGARIAKLHNQSGAQCRWNIGPLNNICFRYIRCRASSVRASCREPHEYCPPESKTISQRGVRGRARRKVFNTVSEFAKG